MHFYLKKKAVKMLSLFELYKGEFGLIFISWPMYYLTNQPVMGSSSEFKGKRTSGYKVSDKVFMHIDLGV